MQRNRLLFVPFVVGLILIAYAWFASFPLLIVSVNDYVFNHVSIFYWIGLPLLLVSAFAIMVSFKSSLIKSVFLVVIVLGMYSLPFFYSSYTGSDSHYFMGLTEYSVYEGNLVPSTPARYYFEYPAFFVLADLFVKVTGLEVASYGLLFYALSLVILVLSVLFYARRFEKQSGFLAVISFFILMFYFIDVQFAPFTLALVLLFVALVVDVGLKESRGKTIIILLLFIGMVITHPFVPLFFSLYKIIAWVQAPSRRREELYLSLLSLTVYFLYQFSLSPQTFLQTVESLESSISDYSAVAAATSASAAVPIDAFAQLISRTVVVATSVLVFIGFIYLVRRGRTRFGGKDRTILLLGLVSVVIGFPIALLGTRGIALVGLAVCPGVAHVLQTRLKKIVVVIFAVLLALFVFLPMHSSFYDQQIFFQTNEEYAADNFVLSHFNWTNPISMLVHYRVATYLLARQASNVTFQTDSSASFAEAINSSDAVFYTLGLGKNLREYDSSLGDLSAEFSSDVVYDNGFSSLILRVNSSNSSNP